MDTVLGHLAGPAPVGPHVAQEPVGEQAKQVGVIGGDGHSCSLGAESRTAGDGLVIPLGQISVESTGRAGGQRPTAVALAEFDDSPAEGGVVFVTDVTDELGNMSLQETAQKRGRVRW